MNKLMELATKMATKFSPTVALTGLGCLMVLVAILINGIIGALLFPYIFNAWLVYTGHTAVFLWWWGFILGNVPYCAKASIVGAIFTFIFMLFI